jgi:hypothetical protein
MDYKLGIFGEKPVFQYWLQHQMLRVALRLYQEGTPTQQMSILVIKPVWRLQ